MKELNYPINRNNKKKVIIVLVLLFVILSIAFIYKFSHIKSTPNISVGIKSEKISEQSYTIKWYVKNNSQTNVTFKGENIRLCKLDSRNHLFKDTLPKKVILQPGEEYNFEFILDGLNKGNHLLNMTAQCEKGTKASYKIYLNIE